MDSRFEKYKILALKIYMINLVTRLLIHIIIQCIEIDMQQSYENSIEVEQENKVASRVKKIHDLMRSIGQIHRGTKTSGIFYYSLYLASSFTFYTIKFLSAGKIKEFYHNNSFIEFLRNPVEQNKKISQRIKDCVQRVANSNLNFTRAVLLQHSQQLINRKDKFACEGQDCGGRFGGDFLSNNHSVGMIKNLSSRKSYELLSFRSSPRALPDDTEAKDRVIFGMAKQLEYLNDFSRVTKEVWPDNRNRNWEKYLKYMWLNMYLILSPTIWFLGIICAHVAIYLAFQAIRNNPVDIEFDNISLIDRIWSADYSFYCFFGAESFLAPFMILVIGVLDQTKCLASLLPKFINLCEKKKQLEQLNDTRDLSDKELEQAKKKLMLECDKDALNLYICYQLFQDDIRSIIELAQRAIGLYVTFVVIALLPTFVYYKHIPAQHLPIGLSLSMGLMVSINMSFCWVAVLNASCRRTIKMAWSLIGIFEGYNYRCYSTYLERMPQSKFSNFSDLRSSIFFKTGLSRPTSMIDFEYYSHSFITPHTVLLWRRIVSKQEMVNERFTCRLYNRIDIDFTGILRTNYWVITSILFILTSHN